MIRSRPEAEYESCCRTCRPGTYTDDRGTDSPAIAVDHSGIPLSSWEIAVSAGRRVSLGACEVRQADRHRLCPTPIR
ncbi:MULTISPECIES: hypothetical protein [unclassified Nocardia]|uniref:hypothetical protein n=1 Tax=unclassified Nocardia TaxID=2637762 RepID=UPI001CE483CF|nr:MULTISPECIES: hypothetical protein [unclassified Nocardia]